MVCKIFFCSEFPAIPEKSWRRRRWRKPANAKRFAFQAKTKIILSRVFMVVTCYIKLFCTGADRRNGILMSLLPLVAETISETKLDQSFSNAQFNISGYEIRKRKDSHNHG